EVAVQALAGEDVRLPRRGRFLHVPNGVATGIDKALAQPFGSPEQLPRVDHGLVIAPRRGSEGQAQVAGDGKGRARAPGPGRGQGGAAGRRIAPGPPARRAVAVGVPRPARLQRLQGLVVEGHGRLPSASIPDALPASPTGTALCPFFATPRGRPAG